MNRIEPKHIQAMVSILEGNTISKTAEIVGVSRITIHRWLREPLFQQHLNSLIVNETKHDVKRVLDAMIEAAVKEKNAAAAKIVLSAHNIGTGNDKVEVNVNQNEIDINKLREELKNL